MDSSTPYVTLTSKHRFTVPAAVVRQLKAAAGDRFTFQIIDGSLIFKPRPTISQ